MTVQVGIVNLLLETHGGARHQGDATWYLSNLVFITMSPLHTQSLFVCLIVSHQVDISAIFIMPEKRSVKSLLNIRSPPLAAITFRDLVLYTTNEKWQVLSLLLIIIKLINGNVELHDFNAMYTGSKLERSKGFLQQQRIHLCFQGLMLPACFQLLKINACF